MKFFVFAFAFFPFLSQAQGTDSLEENKLTEVVIRAYEQNRKLKDVPAAINYIGRATFDRFNTASVVQAINSTPGIRMEERSPGSYRINIRGSSIRSPFGVRNVKVYFNDIPITDPGGFTYLNQFGFYNFHSISVIKGPGSSLYGAGTGGVLMIESLDENSRPGIRSEYATGNFGLHNFYAGISTGTEKLVSHGGFQHQQNNGYRRQSAIKRQVHNWTGIFRINEKKILKASFLYGDLFYETPGALTRDEYKSDPRMARPPAGIFPGAVDAKASIRQRTFLTGISYTQQFAKRWQNKSVLYGMFTDLQNPNLRNYDKSTNPHAGGRTIFKYSGPLGQGIITWDAGGEWQEGFSTADIYKNANGTPDSLQVHDEINTRQTFLFTQASFDLNTWYFMAGASWNQQKLIFQRFTPASSGRQRREFDNEIAPRISIMKAFGSINIYGSMSKGFSPPTTSELLPTGGNINSSLDPEEGINYDIGVKTGFKNFFADVNAFLFSLKNTIVQRRDAGGGDYFINAGKTKQMGIESQINYAFKFPGTLFKNSLFWLSHTWHDFTYMEFTQVNNDYSNNKIPGTSMHTVAGGLDLKGSRGLSVSFNFYHAGKIPLNDANTFYADPYHLVGIKAGYEIFLKKWLFKLSAGGENLLDQKYSLGNDINGFGGRFFNAAPGINFFIGLQMQWISRKILL